MSSIVCEDLCKTFQQGDEVITGLDNVSIEIEAGDFVCLSGPSGSGKTTLLNAMGGLDTPDSGKIQVGDTRVDQLGKGPLPQMPGAGGGRGQPAPFAPRPVPGT